MEVLEFIEVCVEEWNDPDGEELLQLGLFNLECARGESGEGKVGELRRPTMVGRSKSWSTRASSFILTLRRAATREIRDKNLT